MNFKTPAITLAKLLKHYIIWLPPPISSLRSDISLSFTGPLIIGFSHVCIACITHVCVCLGRSFVSMGSILCLIEVFILFWCMIGTVCLPGSNYQDFLIWFVMTESLSLYLLLPPSSLPLSLPPFLFRWSCWTSNQLFVIRLCVNWRCFTSATLPTLSGSLAASVSTTKYPYACSTWWVIHVCMCMHVHVHVHL